MNKLSEAAESALINTSARQGAAIITTPAVQWELENAGLVGTGVGITRRGLIERERIVNARLDAAF